jgi:hypothetical protein
LKFDSSAENQSWKEKGPSTFGESAQEYQDLTNQNDPNILQSLRPEMREEKECKKSPFEEGVEQQRESGFGREQQNPEPQPEPTPEQPKRKI